MMKFIQINGDTFLNSDHIVSIHINKTSIGVKDINKDMFYFRMYPEETVPDALTRLQKLIATE